MAEQNPSVSYIIPTSKIDEFKQRFNHEIVSIPKANVENELKTKNGENFVYWLVIKMSDVCSSKYEDHILFTDKGKLLRILVWDEVESDSSRKCYCCHLAEMEFNISIPNSIVAKIRNLISIDDKYIYQLISTIPIHYRICC